MSGFQYLLHADWSTAARGRWVAEGRRDGSGWRIAAPRPVGDCAVFADRLRHLPGPVLAGFDFPLGLPAAFGRATGLADFPTALRQFGQGTWSDFFLVAERPEQIAPTRPFYPRASSDAARQHHLLDALGAENLDALRRRCERATATRRAACPLFWTLGGNQVGKAAIAGWREVVIPALASGARLWPFHGTLEALSRGGAPVLAETYPAEAYAHAGVRFHPGMSKRRPADCRLAMTGLPHHAARHGIVFSPELQAAVDDGFAAAGQDDAFDALIGLLGMIEVIEHRRPERPAAPDPDAAWEGWILGQG